MKQAVPEILCLQMWARYHEYQLECNTIIQVSRCDRIVNLDKSQIDILCLLVFVCPYTKGGGAFRWLLRANAKPPKRLKFYVWATTEWYEDKKPRRLKFMKLA